MCSFEEATEVIGVSNQKEGSFVAAKSRYLHVFRDEDLRFGGTNILGFADIFTSCSYIASRGWVLLSILRSSL